MVIYKQCWTMVLAMVTARCLSSMYDNAFHTTTLSKGLTKKSHTFQPTVTLKISLKSKLVTTE